MGQAMLCHVTACGAVPCIVVACSAVRCIAVACGATLWWHAVPCRALWWHTAPCRALRWRAALCRALWRHAVPCRALWWPAVLCRIVVACRVVPCTVARTGNLAHQMEVGCWCLHWVGQAVPGSGGMQGCTQQGWQALKLCRDRAARLKWVSTTPWCVAWLA